MAENEYIQTGVLVAFGGAIGHFLSWLLRFLKLRAAREERVQDDTFQYASMLRKDMDDMKREMASLRAEHDSLRAQYVELLARDAEKSAKLEALYEQNLELARKNRSMAEHVEKCVVEQRIATSAEKTGE